MSYSNVINLLLTDFFEGKIDNYRPEQLEKLKYEFLCVPDDNYISNVLESLSCDDQIKYFTKMCKAKKKSTVIDIFTEYFKDIDMLVLKAVCKNVNDWSMYLKVLEEHRYENDNDYDNAYNFIVTYDAWGTQVSDDFLNRKKPKKEKKEIYNVKDIMETLIENLGDNFLSDTKIMTPDFKRYVSNFMDEITVADLRKMLKEYNVSLVKRDSTVRISKYNIKDIKFCLNTKTPFKLPESIKKIGFNKLLDFKELIEEHMEDKKTRNFIYNYTDLFGYMRLFFTAIAAKDSFKNHEVGQEVLEEVGLMLCNVSQMKSFVVRLGKKNKNIFQQATNFYKL